MRSSVAAFALGVLFSIGLGIGGMLHPERVQGFLDVFGAWDLTLAFVMGGAVVVSTIGFRLTRNRPAPLWQSKFSWPTKREIDLKLLVGSAIFGLGWGASGLCPGPAVASLVTLDPDLLIFVAAMLAGMGTHTLIERRRERG